MTKKYDYILQESDNDCGIASIMTILLYYKIKVSRESIINELNLSEEGISAYDLIKVGKQYGLKGYGINAKIEKLDNKFFPLISHTIKNKNFYHYIVILENNKKTKTLKIMDPSFGIEEITYEKFNEITTNIFIIFENKNLIKQKDKRFKKVLITLCKSNKNLIYKTLFLSIFFISFSIMYNYYLKIIINSNNINKLLSIFIIFVSISLIKNILDYIKNNTILNLNINIDKTITKNVISHILHLPYKYYKTKKVGEFVTIISDIENFKEIITKIFVLCLIDVFLIFLLLLFISFYNIVYVLIILIFIYIYIIITLKYQYIFNDIFVKLKNKKINYNSNLVSSLNSFDSIKNLNIENKIIKEITSNYKDVLNYDKQYSKKYYKFEIKTNIFTEIFYLLFLFISIYIIRKTGSDLSNIIIFSNFYNIIFSFIKDISDCLVMYKIYQTSVDKILDIIDIKEEKFIETRMDSINKIEFKNVHYKINDKEILSNINLTINNKDHLFIKGKSGIGKSTMMKLLLRYDNLSSGNILIDNIDINSLELSFIRKNITYVSQNENILSNTLDNDLNKINKSQKDKIKACNTVLLNEMFIYNKIDFNLYLEENASNISGGQRKKIILARALLKKSDILILDEVFNEIDVTEERKILKNIYNNYPLLTVIVISHRYNNIDLFNKIFELKEEKNEKNK